MLYRTTSRMTNPKKTLSLETLPLELVYEIVSHIYDFQTLLSCSMTRATYCAKSPCPIYTTSSKSQTPKIIKDPGPLDKSPLELEKHPHIDHVKRLVLHFFFPLDGGHDGRGLDPFICDQNNLRDFSALKSLRELRINHLQLSKNFIPIIQGYSGSLLPTFQSLALYWPETSCQQILYFVGLFQNLRDLRLIMFPPSNEDETTATLALTPLSNLHWMGC